MLLVVVMMPVATSMTRIMLISRKVYLRKTTKIVRAAACLFANTLGLQRVGEQTSFLGGVV
jgi:hypothetical protein